MPPDIVAAIKRMDLPGEGDAAFIGARKLLQRAKLGFGRIAEALDNTGVSPAEHSSLEEEFTKLQHAYWAERDKNIRQQGTIIGLKAATGQSWAPLGVLAGLVAVAILHYGGAGALMGIGAGMTRAVTLAPAAAVPAPPAPISPTVHTPAYEPPKQLRPQPRRDHRITDRPYHGSFRRSRSWTDRRQPKSPPRQAPPQRHASLHGGSRFCPFSPASENPRRRWLPGTGLRQPRPSAEASSCKRAVAWQVAATPVDSGHSSFLTSMGQDRTRIRSLNTSTSRSPRRCIQ